MVTAPFLWMTSTAEGYESVRDASMNKFHGDAGISMLKLTYQSWKSYSEREMSMLRHHHGHHHHHAESVLAALSGMAK
jgi:hypothetical protein